ncbi:hypothetical protein EVAR_38918_1 [Eumeta japonica]|uniref:Uncharacterized protein n=1 Tax=Eumeta variegata TaxID=151549 RepID=A0A4C1ZRI5_EUMVA|nr:hypothetical protein EVAR_38918_1 [Eumeta japonica]
MLEATIIHSASRLNHGARALFGPMRDQTFRSGVRVTVCSGVAVPLAAVTLDRPWSLDPDPRPQTFRFAKIDLTSSVLGRYSQHQPGGEPSRATKAV